MALNLNPLIAAGVMASTAATDAVYVMFNAAVTARRPSRAASWSALWYLLSAFAVISYTGKLDLRNLRRNRLMDRRLFFSPMAEPLSRKDKPRRPRRNRKSAGVMCR